MSDTTETKTYLVSRENMQKLADADAVLADLAIGLMMQGRGFGDPLWEKVTDVGLPLYEFQQELVDMGLAEARLDRSDLETEEE